MEKINFILKNIFKKNHKHESFVNPHKHWIYILNTFFVTLFLLIIFSFYLLHGIVKDNFFKNDINNTQKDILISRNEKLLINVKSYFNTKAEKMEFLKNNELKLSDPRFTK